MGSVAVLPFGLLLLLLLLLLGGGELPPVARGTTLPSPPGLEPGFELGLGVGLGVGVAFPFPLLFWLLLLAFGALLLLLFCDHRCKVHAAMLEWQPTAKARATTSSQACICRACIPKDIWTQAKDFNQRSSHCCC